MPTNQSLIVETECGLVQGVAEGNIQAFYGLRYAEPPERFQAPRPLRPWQGVMMADSYGPAAMQTGELPYNASQSEDCLTLNLWTTGLDQPKRPVLLYIHGGGFTGGSGSDPLFHGRTFAENGDIIVVTVNYRLGILGFLDLHAALGDDYRSSGNCGLLDLIEALRWIRSNIARFGGDPDNVTIMGQSAGAKCIGGLLCSPLAEGLFQRAIAISGSVQSIRDQVTSAQLAEHFLSSLGLTFQDAHKLLELPVQSLMDAQREWAGDFRSIHLFGPVIDGVVIDKPPLERLRSQGGHLPPLLIGTNRNETAGFIADIPFLQKPSVELLKAMFGGNANAVLNAYERLSGRSIEKEPDLSAWEATLTDCMYRIAAIRTAEACSEGGGLVWLYRFDRKGPNGASHGDEFPFVWHKEFQEHEAALAHLMHQAWISFIRTGTPQLPEGPLMWPAFNSAERNIMIFDHESCLDRLEDWYDDPDFSTQVFTL